MVCHLWSVSSRVFCVVRDYPPLGGEYFPSRAIGPELSLVIAEWDNRSNPGTFPNDKARNILPSPTSIDDYILGSGQDITSRIKPKRIVHIVVNVLGTKSEHMWNCGFAWNRNFKSFLITKTHFAICCLLKWGPGKGYKLLIMSNRMPKYYQWCRNSHSVFVTTAMLKMRFECIILKLINSHRTTKKLEQ